jgi:pyocin large subunit-like protein
MENRVRALTPLRLGAVSALAILSLAACDGAPSAIPSRSHAASAGADRRLADSAPDGEEGRSPDRRSNAGSGAARVEAADTPMFHGKPLWAANRKHSAQENADYHFKRDGEVFGAASEDEFLTKVHAFIDSPPKGVLTLTRSNGDKLMYDPQQNIFAVADKQGAPRTLFKPKEGQAYWDKQKDALDKGEDYPGSRRSARRSGADDNG